MTEDEFAAYMEQIVRMGACVIGGCCGTTPEHIRAMRKRCENAELVPVTEKEFTVVSSYGQSVILGEGSKLSESG